MSIMATATTTRPKAKGRSRSQGVAMDSITLENFRCFGETQTAQLAPLTLLVGENSTGKTSLMAMIRILWDIFYGREGYSFNEYPFDLGTFKDIAFRTNGEQAENFSAGFEQQNYIYGVQFGKDGAFPVLKKKEIAKDNVSLTHQVNSDKYTALLATANGSWRLHRKLRTYETLEEVPRFRFMTPPLSGDLQDGFKPLQGSPAITNDDLEQVQALERHTFQFWRRYGIRPYAGAPVRTKPGRTYDPYRPDFEPEGNHIPMFLANLSRKDKDHWQHIKQSIERFGKQSGILDRIDIKHLGDRNEPFKIVVRKGGKGKLGPWRNLKDVGYGVSQILPLLTDIFRKDSPNIYLLQQPEGHLHPRVQVELATLFCQQAKENKQFVIETHCDYIIDRVRMEVRDGLISSDDVSVVYFERDGLGVRIHCLKYDEAGNVMGAPPSYGKFFMEEVDRALGI